MKAIVSTNCDPKYILQNETWKFVKGLESLYEISSFGNVRSLDRVVMTKRGNVKYKGKALCATINPSGYPVFSVKNKTYFIHVEVAKAFIPNIEGKKEVNHIDGVKLNCHVSNLEWATRHENIAHAFKTGLIVTTRGEKQSQTKLTKEIVLDIMNSKDTVRALGAKYGVGHSCIVSIKTGKSWNHITGLPRHRSMKNKFIV